ncbi:MAG: TIR domain-containing protein [Gammaproteobacteria bacterium]|nr:TIR domain-containing protein [Gammaproteobacteria bacterium]NIR85409.1 TIR domain-containing protein [Gammaproteobacteria bacterium]NIR89076.1 TIR domain-containing protein [Gammaproteobacteria bacterium]NIU06539.1 TIR domain-containing protein [Gammaproteobacteria bacterium]NIV53428.1 TIR domain-containing protein [Gammaproteobacteria bacterium]
MTSRRDRPERPATSREAAVALVRDAKRLFIAYSHADLKRATDLHRRILRLRPESDPDTAFLDQASLRPGDSVAPEVVEARLREADLLLVLCGRDTAERPHVSREVALALERQRAGDLTILPVILQPGVRLPDGLDFRVQGIFAEVLFPELRWQRLSAAAGGGVIAVLLALALFRAAWAAWFAPTEAWTPVPLPESGWDEALLVRTPDGREVVRTQRVFVERGVFAEDVDNTNRVFLEVDASGHVTGAFATTADDAGNFRDGREIERNGGVGSLESAVADLAGELPDGDAIWNVLGEHASRCLPLGWHDGLEEMLERVQAVRANVREKDVRTCRLGAGAALALFPTDFDRTEAWALVAESEVRQGRAPLDPTGIAAIAKRVPRDGTLALVTRDTFWEDSGTRGGLFRSVDGGVHWERLALEEPWDQVTLEGIAFGFGNSRRMALSYAEAQGGARGILVSDDAGATWRALTTGMASATTRQVRLVGVGKQGDVWVALPGGRLARWRSLTFAERFAGLEPVEP